MSKLFADIHPLVDVAPPPFPSDEPLLPDAAAEPPAPAASVSPMPLNSTESPPARYTEAHTLTERLAYSILKVLGRNPADSD